MLKKGNFGHVHFLQLTCFVLNGDMISIPLFKDQANISALGFLIFFNAFSSRQFFQTKLRTSYKNTGGTISPQRLTVKQNR